MSDEAPQDTATRITEAGRRAVATTATLADLTALETTLLGKKSELSLARRALGSMDPDRRKEAGAAFNATARPWSRRSRPAAPSWPRPSCGPPWTPRRWT
ncbi:MAG: hypothetical protein R2704_18750 [Microthrixaceae bacterium]